ncbi:MAG: hypothetical protein CMN28_05800 [Salinisphaeraceae bacterium]|nr:hypothetical protein [Salinisphaeraceae bacterium]
MAQTLKYWYGIRESYWFVPTVMALLAAVAAVVLGWVDSALGDQWTGDVPWFVGSHPDGARAMLSTIAGSMITVAGVTFSVTIAAVAYTTSQFGPRLLTNFMSDRGNQITLGTFIATFVYCMLVLRNVRTAGEGFVPQISLFFALSLAIASIAVLIYFIHHVTESIHISNVVADIGRDLEKTLHRDSQRDGPAHHRHPAEQMTGAYARVSCGGNGYIQHLVESRLLELAEKSDTLVQLERQPGDFVHYGQTLARVWPADRADDKLLDQMSQAYALGRSRTLVEDMMLLVDELVEIAARALSPGINDPFTAMSCLDWLRTALVRFASTPPPSPYRHDEAGALRLIRPVLDFDTLIEQIYTRLRPYFCADPSAACHMIDSLGHIAPLLSEPQRRTLAGQNEALHEASQALLGAEPDRARVTRHYQACRDRIDSLA